MPSTSVVLVAVAAGGALGAAGRYLLGRLVFAWGGGAYVLPAGTWLANGIGCFAAGLLLGWLSTRHPPSELLMAFLMTGVLGGFTTFSAFSVETLRLLHGASIAAAAANVMVNLAVSLFGVALGWYCVHAMWR